MESIVQELGLKPLPGWVLIFLGVIDVLERITFVTEHLRWLTSPWGRLGLIPLGLIYLFLLHFIERRRKKSVLRQQPNPSRLDAMNRIRDLLSKGQWFSNNAPRSNATANDLCRLWREQVRFWQQDTSAVLTANWGQEAQQNFFSMVGERITTDAPDGIDPDCATDLQQLNRWLKNLDQLKQTLSTN